MRKNIVFYPTLDDNAGLFDEINPQVTYSFSFDSKNGVTQLNSSIEHNTIKLDVGDTFWNFDDFNLNFTASLKLKNANKLFGKYGVAPTNSSIGVCLEWYSAQSKIRELIIDPSSIKEGDIEKEYVFSCKLPKKRIIGSININISLFLKESAKKVDIEDKFLNNKENVLLGCLEEKILLLNGVGSLFPIRVENLSNDDRLWTVAISYDDPFTTILSDGMVVILNSAHKSFPFVDPEGPHYCQQLVDEIVCDSIAILLFKLKEDGYLDQTDGNIDNNGSIMAYADYCKNSMGIKFDNAQSIMESLRAFLEKENKNAI